MRIVDRLTFLDLPEGTVYAQGERWVFQPLHIKGETHHPASDDFSGSWYALDPCWIEAKDSGHADECLDEMLKNGVSYPMQASQTSDSQYERDALFLVFERDDLVKLRDLIDQAIEVSPT